MIEIKMTFFVITVLPYIETIYFGDFWSYVNELHVGCKYLQFHGANMLKQSLTYSDILIDTYVSGKLIQ